MELIELINERLDPEEVVDALGLTTEELTILLWEEIYRNKERFMYLTMEGDPDYDE